MRNLVFAIALMLGFNGYAQNGSENSDVFVRVFDLQGKKIGKGKIFLISEISLQLNRNGNYVEIPVSDIGSIKTKRSEGNNLLAGAISGAIVMGAAGAASADPDAFLPYTAGEGAGIGALAGAGVGAGVGVLTIFFKNSETYQIEGDSAKWKAFMEMIIR